jgi:copper(I)-binding protein
MRWLPSRAAQAANMHDARRRASRPLSRAAAGAGAAAALLFLAGAATAAEPVPGPIEISAPWTVPARRGADATVYMTVTNRGPLPDAMISASCPTLGPVAFVQPAGAAPPPSGLVEIPVPAHGAADLTATGYHFVIHGLEQELRPGWNFGCTVNFRHAGEQVIEIFVRNGPPPPARPD